MKGIKFISVLIFMGMISGLATAEIQRRNALQEVTVTAQKRPQLLQETAIAMSVLTSEQLELQGITSLEDMHGGAIASLRMFASGNTPSNLIVAIRGNGTGDPSEITREGSVAVYLDGVYMARSQGLALELSELERIEVLRGPQGALFGRNSIGGAVSLVTKKPTGQFGIKQALTMGRFNELKSVTRINLPEMSGVRAKLDFLHSEPDLIALRTLSGRISVHVLSISIRHSGLLPTKPVLSHPAGNGLSWNQYEYCSSGLTTTQNFIVSTLCSLVFFPFDLTTIVKTPVTVTAG